MAAVAATASGRAGGRIAETARHAAVAMLGLSTIVAGLGRGFRLRPASRQLLTGSRQPTSALQEHNDQVFRDRDVPDGWSAATAQHAP